MPYPSDKWRPTDLFLRDPKIKRDVKSTHASTHGKWLPTVSDASVTLWLCVSGKVAIPDRILGCLASATFG